MCQWQRGDEGSGWSAGDSEAGRGGDGGGGLRRGGGEEAPASSLALVCLALSNGQSLGTSVPGTTGQGSFFFRSSALPTSSSPHRIPSCLASDMPNLGMAESFAGSTGLWHLSLRPPGLCQGGIGRQHGQWVGVTPFHFRWVGLR